MKVFKKTLAILCSATLIVSSSVTAFAGDEASSAATGNVIAYDFDTVTVPTTIKIAFNPQGLPIKIGEGESDVTTAKIVSLNYGIANKASTDKKVVVKFAANAAVVDGETKDLTFVDAETKAQAKSESNATGAEAGDHKIYLRVAPATDEPTINDGENDGAGTAFGVTTAEDHSKSDNASGANLANVKMEAAAAAKSVAFATGTNNDAFANIGFVLDKATYALKYGESIDFDTAQSAVASKLELNAFGETSITGFTFAGEMNENTVWTEANITAISITPTYEFTDKTTEAALDGTHGMFTLTEDEDIAEPAAPTPSAETLASGFKTTYSDVLALTEDTVQGTEEELAAIDTAIAAFDDLSEDVQAVLAEEDPEITADTLAAIRALSVAAGTVETTGVYDSTNQHYRINLAEAVTSVDDITNVKVNGVEVEILELNSTKNLAKITRDAVRAALGGTNDPAWANASEFEFTFTVDGVNYKCTIGKNG